MYQRPYDFVREAPEKPPHSIVYLGDNQLNGHSSCVLIGDHASATANNQFAIGIGSSDFRIGLKPESINNWAVVEKCFDVDAHLRLTIDGIDYLVPLRAAVRLSEK